ncbi:hypothetical protein VNI00_000103 [Paramarasmius palmivorus]|uniref:Uncharacterized protein n=1 Tax=Paramarasmius palmivorus TaxID=297713 RepID=A0AAW0ECL4_9AGAR
MASLKASWIKSSRPEPKPEPESSQSQTFSSDPLDFEPVESFQGVIRRSRSFRPFDEKEKSHQFISFNEYRGAREPSKKLGAKGDIFITTTPSSPALYARLSGGWQLWDVPKPRWQEKKLVTVDKAHWHPQHSNCLLWVTRRGEVDWLSMRSLERKLERQARKVLLDTASDIVKSVLDSEKNKKRKNPSSASAGPSSKKGRIEHFKDPSTSATAPPAIQAQASSGSISQPSTPRKSAINSSATPHRPEPGPSPQHAPTPTHLHHDGQSSFGFEDVHIDMGDTGMHGVVDEDQPMWEASSTSVASAPSQMAQTYSEAEVERILRENTALKKQLRGMQEGQPVLEDEAPKSQEIPSSALAAVKHSEAPPKAVLGATTQHEPKMTKPQKPQSTISTTSDISAAHEAEVFETLHAPSVSPVLATKILPAKKPKETSVQATPAVDKGKEKERPRPRPIPKEELNEPVLSVPSNAVGGSSAQPIDLTLDSDDEGISQRQKKSTPVQKLKRKPPAASERAGSSLSSATATKPARNGPYTEPIVIEDSDDEPTEVEKPASTRTKGKERAQVPDDIVKVKQEKSSETSGIAQTQEYPASSLPTKPSTRIVRSPTVTSTGDEEIDQLDPSSPSHDSGFDESTGAAQATPATVCNRTPYKDPPLKKESSEHPNLGQSGYPIPDWCSTIERRDLFISALFTESIHGKTWTCGTCMQAGAPKNQYQWKRAITSPWELIRHTEEKHPGAEQKYWKDELLRATVDAKKAKLKEMMAELEQAKRGSNSTKRDLPPDSLNAKGDPSSSEPPKKSEGQDEVSDREWEVRTGRAIDVLTQTLPDFFESTGEPRPTSSIHIPVVNVNPLDYRARNESLESIYSPKVRLSYTPPVELPTPFPKTLHIEGLPLYIASSAFVRHTLNTLYSDLRVTLHKVVVNTPKSSPRYPSANHSDGDSEDQPHVSSKPKPNREKSLFIGLTVTGNSRVSRAVGEWEVNCTYGFSPNTGLIHVHTINSIEPAPHQTVYDALRTSLGSVFGFGVPEASDRIERPGGAAGAAFDGRQSQPELEVERVTSGRN